MRPTRRRGASSDQPEPPKAGDLSVCFACAELLVFNEDLSLRLLTNEHLAELDIDTKTDLMYAHRFVKEQIAKRAVQ